MDGGSSDVAERVADLLHQYAVLLDVGRRFSSELSLDVLLPQLIEVVSKSLRAEVATLFLYDADTDELYSRVLQGGEVNEIRISTDAGIVGSVFRSGDPLTIPDAYADSRFNQKVDQETGFKTRDIVCVPLTNRSGEVIGAAQVLNKREGTFGDFGHRPSVHHHDPCGECVGARPAVRKNGKSAAGRRAHDGDHGRDLIRDQP